MRSFSLFVSLALLLSLQVFAQTPQPQDPLAGKWSTPKKTVDTTADCCVPDSIEITKSGSGYTGTYSYSKWTNLKCVGMFLLSSERNVDIKKKTTSDAYGVSVHILDTIPVEGYRARVLAGNQLNLYNPGNSTVAEASICDFTMTNFEPAGTTSTSIPITYIAIGAGGFLIILCIACKCRQKKQIIIIQKESGYGAPNMYNAPNPYIQHQQPQAFIQTR